jgi:hypothetical protein
MLSREPTATSMSSGDRMTRNFRSPFRGQRLCPCSATKATHSAQVCSGVGSLFGACCPATISRLVVAVIVYTVNGMTRRRSAPHVGQEGFVRMRPAFTHGDASRSIVFISNMTRVAASGFHAPPNLIFWRAASSGCFAVLSSRFTGLRVVMMEAAATLSACSPKRTSLDRDSCTAIAAAQPSSIPVYSLGVSLDNCQPRESTAH